MFLLLESSFFSRFTKWNFLFNLLNISGIITFSPGFCCCISQNILFTFYSALTPKSIELMIKKTNLTLYNAVIIDFVFHILPFFYWTYYCIKNRIIIKLNEALFVSFLYIIWLRSRSIYSNSYTLESWDMSHIYVKHNYKISFTYGLYGSLITREFINKRNIYILLIPLLHIILGQLSNRDIIII
jgi:hypothetical protein